MSRRFQLHREAQLRQSIEQPRRDVHFHLTPGHRVNVVGTVMQILPADEQQLSGPDEALKGQWMTA